MSLLPLAPKMDQVEFKNNWNTQEPSAYNSNDAHEIFLVLKDLKIIKKACINTGLAAYNIV